MRRSVDQTQLAQDRMRLRICANTANVKSRKEGKNSLSFWKTMSFRKIIFPRVYRWWKNNNLFHSHFSFQRSHFALVPASVQKGRVPLLSNVLLIIPTPFCPVNASFCCLCILILKPTGHVMHQQFNIQQKYVLPTLYLCVLYLSENKQRLVPLTA